jgi:hypothetical protein
LYTYGVVNGVVKDLVKRGTETNLLQVDVQE